MKIVTICDSTNLKNCFTYDEIQIPQSDGSMETFKVDDIKNGKVFLPAATGTEEYKDVAGIVLADGTPMLLTWNINCPISDPDGIGRDDGMSYSRAENKTGRSKSSTTACIKGIYDLNGNRGPNRLGKDIIGFNVKGLGSTLQITEIAGVKWLGEVFKPNGIDVNDYCPNGELTSEAVAARISYCCDSCTAGNWGSDGWADAMIQCKAAGGRLPTMNELAKLATYLYNASSQIGDDENYNTTPLDTSKLTGSIFEGLGSSWTDLWSSSEDGYRDAYYRIFENGITWKNRMDRSEGLRAVCVAD